MIRPNETSSVTTFEHFSTSQRTGATVVAVCASLSTLALALIALRSIQLATMVFLERNESTPRSPQMLFFRTQLGHYSGCLILSNLFISCSGLIGFNWVSHSRLSQGSTCLAQAVLMQIGIWSTCYFMIALSVHTLVSFVFRISPSRWSSLVALTIGWIIALIAGLVPIQKNNVYGPAGLSCGITDSYSKDEFPLQALPILLAAFMSAIVYSAIFIILHGKPRVNRLRKLRLLAPNLDQRGDDRLEVHDGSIRTIVRCMLWFSLAFVILSLPFCIIHIIMYAGHSVPFALIVFADACISMLGLVNVCLLFNAFRIFGPIHRTRNSSETVKTFGNDASGESPIAGMVFAQSPVRSQQNGHQSYQPTRPFPSHSRDSSWASARSDTELLCAEKALYHSTQARKVAALNDALALSGIIPSGPDHQSRDDVLSHSATLISHVSPTDTRREPPAESKGCSLQSIEDIGASRKGAKELTFKSKAPPISDLSGSPVFSDSLSLHEVTNKSAILAARLGISVTPADSPPQASAVCATQKAEQGNKGLFISPVISILPVGCVDDSNTLSSSPLPSDSGSDYSLETMQVCKIRPLPQIPELDDEEDTVDTRPPSLEIMRSRSKCTTLASVWSQETGYTLTPPDAAALEMYPQPVASLVLPGVIPGDRAVVMRRQVPCAGLPTTPGVVNITSTLGSRHPRTVFAFSDNVV